MSLEAAKFIVGSVAAICTTAAFIPQVLKIRRSGGRDVSYLMLFIFFFGVVLWLIYGIILRAGEVIAANGATICLVAACLVLKWKHEHRVRLGSDTELHKERPKTRQPISEISAD